MDSVNIELDKEDWETVLSWFGLCCKEGYETDDDVEVYNKIKSQIK